MEWTLDKKGQAFVIARKDSSHTTLLKQERYYDERGRLWKTEDLYKDPSQTYSDAVTTITRYKTGHVSTVTDARSKTTTTLYDNAWRRTKVTDHAGNFTEWTLDDNGNPTAWMIHDEDGASDVEHEYEATYDALNRRLTTVEIDRTNGANTYTTTNGYDSRSNLVWQVNAEGNPTRWAYDGLGRMLTKDVALTVGSPITSFSTYIRTQWGFDDNDRLVSHKDDAANETTWAYDALDRATTMTYPDSTDVTYTYDAEDNVTQTIDAIGNDIDDTYDSLGRRTSRAVTRASGVLDTTTETFTYDAADRLLSAEDDDYEVEFTYGVLGLGSNVYQEKQSYATGTAYLKTVMKKYDAVGNKTSETYPSSLALTYTYGDVNQVTTIANGVNPIAGYSYSGLRRKQLTLGNGSKTMFSYSGFRGEVGTIDHQDNIGNSLLKLDYGYNKLHDRTFERYGSSGQPGDAFEYDKARRLTVAWMGSDTPSSPSGNVYVKKIEYGMDDDGNRTTVTVTPYGSSAVNTSYTDNNLNQYTVVGGVNRSHDGNGNVSDDGTYLYEYNYKNLICRVKLKSNSSTVAEYKYDALGRRVEKSVTGATYRYIYSGVETVSVYTSTGTWKQDYVYGPGIDEVLMLEQADVLDWDADTNTSELTRSWYRANALGSVMRIEEPDRTEAVSYRYDPYGEVSITRGGTPQGSDPLGQYVTYTGRWRDEETGLYHYRARSYDPVRGRFLQRDPLGVTSVDTLYGYCGSSPLTFVDPSGMTKLRDAYNAWVFATRDVEEATAAVAAALARQSAAEQALQSLLELMAAERAERRGSRKFMCRPRASLWDLMLGWALDELAAANNAVAAAVASLGQSLSSLEAAAQTLRLFGGSTPPSGTPGVWSGTAWTADASDPWRPPGAPPFTPWRVAGSAKDEDGPSSETLVEIGGELDLVTRTGEVLGPSKYESGSVYTGTTGDVYVAFYSPGWGFVGPHEVWFYYQGGAGFHGQNPYTGLPGLGPTASGGSSSGATSYQTGFHRREVRPGSGIPVRGAGGPGLTPRKRK